MYVYTYILENIADRYQTILQTIARRMITRKRECKFQSNMTKMQFHAGGCGFSGKIVSRRRISVVSASTVYRPIVVCYSEKGED